MTVVFRTDIGAYTGKGSPLTKEEVDGNFYDLLTRTLDIETGVVFSCESVDYTGASITFNWSDDTSSGPFMLPVATFRAVGEWLNSMPLSYLDVFTVTGTGTFLTLVDHTTPDAPAPFDPAAVSDDTAADPLYLMIGESVDVSGYLRFQGDFTGGTSYFVGDVFLTDVGLIYVSVGHTADATFDIEAVNDDDDLLYRRIAPPAFAAIKTVADVSYTPVTNDAGKYIRCTSDIGCAIVLGIGLATGSGAEYHVRQAGDGPVTFQGFDESVVINPQRDGFASATAWKGATVTIKDVGDDEWDLIGPFGEELTS